MTALMVLIRGLLCLLILGGCAESAAAERRGMEEVERYAIVVGVSRYAHLTNLEYADRDATILGNALTRLGYSVTTLLNYDADPDELKATIVKAGELMDAGYGRESGSLLITFSGHGYSRDGTNYLAMGPARMDGSGRGNLPVKDLLTTMSSTGIGRQFLFVDACRNIPVRAGDTRLPPFVEDGSDRGQGVLYSTAPGDLSYEDSIIGQGVFSHFLAQALSGQASTDASGLITFDAVYDYVRREVSRYVSERYGEIQVPYRAGESTGILSLGRTDDLVNQAQLDMPITGTLAPQSTIRHSDPDPLSTRPSRVWKILGIAAGVLAIGALIDASDSESEPSSAGITLVFPTP